MKKKTFILGGISLILMGLVGWEYALLSQQPVPQDMQKIWLTTRAVPDSINMHSYLSGNIARQNQQLEVAVQDYLKVLKQDSTNQALLKTTYLMAMAQGVPETILPYLNQLPFDSETLMLDYLKVAHFLSQNQESQARTILKTKVPHKVDSLLNPLLLSWIEAKNNHKDKALTELTRLDNTPSFAFIQGYQTFLLGVYFNDSNLTQQGLEKIKGKRMPAVGFFPLLKTRLSAREKWQDSDLNIQFQKMEKNYPATAELIQQMGQKDLTFESGLAEIFYLVSADSAGGLLTKEEALFLNSVALSLTPKKQLALIWGAELTNALKMPQVSLNYYAQMSPKSATLLFKEATLLNNLNKNQEALKILQKLFPDNKNNAALFILLAQVHTELNQLPQAIQAYTYLVDHLANKMENAVLAKIYLARANLYYQQNQTDLMLTDLEKAHILLPKDAMIQNDLGYNKLLNNQVEEGFRLVNEAFQQQPKDPYILDSLAFAYFKKDLCQTALPFAEQALALMPQSGLIHAHLGDIYEKLGRKREARFQYKKALDLKNDLPEQMIQELNQKMSFN